MRRCWWTTPPGEPRAFVSANGESLAADAVVLNADVATAYMRLVPARYRRTMTDRRLRGYRYSMCCFLLYLGLDRQYPQLLHHTIVMAPRYRGLIHDIFDGRGLPPDMSLYLHAPTKTDPSMAPPGGESLYVLVPVPHLGHGIDWTREAQPFRDRIVHFLEHDFGLTGLEQSIKFEHRFTPIDFRDDLSSYLGSAFSIEPTLVQSAYFRPAQRLGGYRRAVPGGRRHPPRRGHPRCAAVGPDHQRPGRPGAGARQLEPRRSRPRAALVS